MIYHTKINDHDLHLQIKKGFIRFGGNATLKIFGRLDCRSGKSMKKENRVFFNTVKEPIGTGFRPCGHCMKPAYKQWKNDII